LLSNLAKLWLDTKPVLSYNMDMLSKQHLILNLGKYERQQHYGN